ncbi:MAG: tetratricopeptide repeat protein [Anaerolineae bacterium]|nr:tetratricopeptide repeat protein [Anaerolineae bacterium]
MHIHRDQSRLSFRRHRRRRSNGYSMMVVLGILVGIIVVSWNWIGQRLTFGSAPTNDDALELAQAAFAKGNLDDAVRYAQQAIAQDANNSDAMIVLARSLIYRSYSDYDRAIDRDSALELTTEALSHSPNDPKLMAIQAYALQASGKVADSAKMAENALHLDPNNGLARVAMALAYGGAGSFEIALRESQQVAQNNDWKLEGQRAMAISYGDLGDYKSAIESVERAINLNRYLIPLYFERALYAMQIGDADSATAAYFQVLTYQPDNVKARLRLCELSSLLRERDAAVKYCQEVTDRAPSFADGWYQLGMEYFLQGNFKAAQDSLHRCSSLQVMQNVPPGQRKFECWYVQGQAAEILGDCPNLLATYNEFRAMAKDATVQQTWTYPPEGPPSCSSSAVKATLTPVT